MYDVIIIGGGVVGCAIARELSRYQLKILLCEKENDICCGTSRANSAIVHSGHSAKPGSLMARYNVLGNRMYPELCRELDVSFQMRGSLNVAFSEEELPGLQKLMADGAANGVPGLRLLSREELLKQEPNLGPEALAAVWAPSCGIVNPFELTVALAESAACNGVEFRRGTEVQGIRHLENGNWQVTALDEPAWETRSVVNAAGVYSDVINNMVSQRKLKIQPRRGEYWLLDRSCGEAFHSTIFQVPGPMGKGILVSPTVDGTVLVGPTADDISDKDDKETTAAGLEKVLKIGRRTWPALPRSAAITAFSGIRAHLPEHDFVLGEPEDAPGFFNAAGIESPGLTSAPAIAVDLATQMAEKLSAHQKADFKPGRPPVHRYRELSLVQREALVRKNPLYGRIICRCETVTEAEIRDAIRRPVGARTIDGVKRRVRAGMGRCQGGFCMPKVLQILAEELHISPLEILKDPAGSDILTGTLLESHQSALYATENKKEEGKR